MVFLRLDEELCPTSVFRRGKLAADYTDFADGRTKDIDFSFSISVIRVIRG